MDKEDSEEAVGTIVEVGAEVGELTSEPLPLLAPVMIAFLNPQICLYALIP